MDRDRDTHLDHEDVGALGHVQRGLDEGLAAVRRVLLVRLLVTKARVAVETD